MRSSGGIRVARCMIASAFAAGERLGDGARVEEVEGAVRRCHRLMAGGLESRQQNLAEDAAPTGDEDAHGETFLARINRAEAGPSRIGAGRLAQGIEQDVEPGLGIALAASRQDAASQAGSMPPAAPRRAALGWMVTGPHAGSKCHPEP